MLRPDLNLLVALDGFIDEALQSLGLERQIFASALALAKRAVPT